MIALIFTVVMLIHFEASAPIWFAWVVCELISRVRIVRMEDLNEPKNRP